MDRNKDGVISLEEFIETCRKVRSLISSNDVNLNSQKSELMLTRRATASVQFHTQAFCCLSPVLSAKIHSSNVRRTKFTKPPIFGFQSRSRSSILVPPESSSAVFVMISNKSVSICNRSHARRINSSKITISYRVPLFAALDSRRIFSPSGMKFGHKKTRDSTLSYGANPESLSYLGLNR